MRYLRLLYLYILLMSFPNIIMASFETAIFGHLTTEEGLSQLSVNSIYIDEYGFVWIGTRVGLNVYNGESITTFKKGDNLQEGLSSNFILQLTGNRNGKVYILTTDCLSEYDMISRNFNTLKEGKIDCIYYNERLYITIGNSIYIYDERLSIFKHFFSLPKEISSINSIICDNQNNIWIGTSTCGVFVYNTENNETKHIIKSGNITQLYIDNENSIWIGSWEDGLYIVNNSGKITNHRTSTTQDCISSNFVRAICQDNLNNIWIGTFNGIDKYEKSTKRFVHYTSGNNNNNLTHSSVWCIEKDQQGTLWIGTYFGGVNYINPEYSVYKIYSYSDDEKTGLSSPIVGRMTEDQDGNLWIGTEGGGINFLDKKTQTFRWFKQIPGDSNSISHNNIKSLYYDSEQKALWIGTHTGGLNKLDTRNNKITRFSSNSNDVTTLPSNIVRDIEPYTNDSLVIATQNGICIMNKADGKCRQILNNLPDGKKIGMVADVMFDHKKNLWIAATGEGVYVYNITTGYIKNYRRNDKKEGSISSNNINNIATDKENNIWLCTSGSGLDLYNPDNDSFYNYNYNNGLANNCIYQACESPVTGNILLITTDGFSIFNKKEKKFYNYNSQNGFPIDAINENALYIAKSGEIFLGGIHNMVSFFEKDLIRQRKPYNIIFTDLIVNGKYVKAGDESKILEKALNYTEQITLSHKQNMFTIGFAVTNNIPANQDKIIYKLEGFSEQWNEIRNLNEITYTNLNPGTYTLIVKAENTDSSICKPIKMSIIVKAPFYRTTIAYIIYLLSAIILAWYLISIYTARLRLSESLKLEKKHAENIKKENQQQLKLFTNISHEFRTPLTLIISQIETLVQNNKYTQQTYNKLSVIYQNCMQLRELVTELLDYRKHEMGHLKLQVSSNNIVEFLKENYLLFSDYAYKKNLTLEFVTAEDNIELWFDPKQLQKVINNLLFNAIKNTPEGGKITIKVNKDDSKATITITDNGIGIPAKDIDRIFDIFYQAEGSDSSMPGTTGSGIGLALVKSIITMHQGDIKVTSKQGEGSTFIVTLPLGKEHFSNDTTILSQPTEHFLPVLNFTLENKSSGTSDTGAENNTETIGSPQAAKPKMIIVEDNEQIRLLLKEILSPYYNINTFPDANTALTVIESEIPDIVITDVMMPGMDGKELCKRIKTNQNTSHIPVIILTAQNAVDQYIEGYQTGADDYITKPFNTQLLISRCNNLINSRILLQEKFSHQPETSVQMLANNKLDKDMLDKAIQIIEANINNTDFNMNTFAREMGMARTNLFAKIKSITGQTPNDFITSIRLKKGAFLLKNNPELNITEIAEKIGFSSPRYFSKCFKDLYNISPLTYRKGEESNEDNI